MEEYAGVMSAADKNRELEIQAAERARNPIIQKQREAEDQQRKREVLRSQISAFLDMYRGRCRAAANGQAAARSHAEAVVREVEQTMYARFGDLKGEVALLGAAEYIQELENGIVEVLANLTAVAHEEQRAEAEANLRTRIMGWRTEAQKLGARDVAKFIEAGGARLFLKGDTIHLRGGGAPDERIRTYVSVVRHDLVGLLRAREEEFVIEDAQ